MGFLEDSPAQAGGVQLNDILIAMNGTTIKNGDDLASYLEEYTLPGETLKITVMRNDVTIDLEIVLDQRPSQHGVSPSQVSSAGGPYVPT